MEITLHCKTLKPSEESFTKIGLSILEKTDNEVTLLVPDNWSTCVTENGSTCFLDRLGRVRAVHYVSEIRLLCFYKVSKEYEAKHVSKYVDNVIRLGVKDDMGRFVYISEPFKASSDYDYSRQMNILNEQMYKLYPYWDNPVYYWPFQK